MIKIGNTYNHFDDGKISEIRRESAKIIDIIPFDKIDKETLRLWKKEVKECYWLYNTKTDYFIKAHLKESEEDIVYVRTLNDDWFSLGFWAGRLDLDESLTKHLEE